jgi:Sel1 repeat
MAAPASSGTNRPLTLDHPSFEKLLAAAWVLQCLHDQLHNQQVRDVEAIAEPVETREKRELGGAELQEVMNPMVQSSPTAMEADCKPAALGARATDDGTLAELAKTQEAIKTGMLDLEATVRRLVSLSPRPHSEPAPAEPPPVKATPLERTPVKRETKFAPQPTSVAPVAKASVATQKPGNKRLVSQASSLDLETTLSRLNDAFAHYRTSLRASSTLRSVRNAAIAVPANFQAAFDHLRRGFTRYASTIRVSFTLRSLRAVAVATPVWLLAVIASLMLLEAWLRPPFHAGQATSSTSPSTAEASVKVNPPAVTASTRTASRPARRIESNDFPRPAPLPPLAASHVQITDLETSSVVQQLSRYEINGLRRQAKYGDDSAAFTLGMTYEIGRYVRQNCVEAARWVRTAAEAGNPAAQYNLGLRYRDGDGVAADLRESEKWLRKAAAHRNRQARIALQLLASR